MVDVAHEIQEGCIPPGLAATAPGTCRWLVSLDYDGTLRAAEPPYIAPAFWALMQRLRPFGVRWGINTGRDLPYLFSELADCCPVLPDFICTCERYVYLADAAGRLCPMAEHNQACEAINLRLRSEFQPTLHRALAEIRRTHPHLQWEIAATDPLSVEAADSETMDALMPLLTPLTTAQLAIQRAGRYMRFGDARFNKGTALQLVCHAWGIEASKLFIMGDGQNDIDAFTLFPQAYRSAPADAHPIVLQWMHSHGGFISPENGVIRALSDWFESRVLPQST